MECSQGNVDEYFSNSIRLNGINNNNKIGKNHSPLLRQILGCSSPLLCTVAIGNVVGYSSILFPQLQYEDSTIILNSSEESWIASIATFSMLIACVLGGVFMEKYGHKSLYLFMNALFAIGWMILCFSANIYGLLLGRAVTGCCVGLLSPSVSVYISEITQPTYRGLFLSMQGFTVSFGIFMTHALGIYLKWKIVAVVCALIPIICFILIGIVPESPSWLLDNDKVEQATKSFRWFRGNCLESINEFERLVEGQKMSKLQNVPMGFKNFLTMAKTKSFYKPVTVLMIYFATFQFSGPNVIAFYTTAILKNSIGDNFSEYIATMIVDVSRLVASILSCIVVKNVGRRPLTIFSGIGTTALLFGLSAYLYAASANENLKNLYGIPLTLFALYILVNTIGLNPLAWILTGELFPLKYRNAGSALVSFSNFFYFFISVKITPGLFVVLGEQGVFTLFGICCLMGTMVLTVILPETKNKTLQEIEDNYNDKNSAYLNTITIQDE